MSGRHFLTCLFLAAICLLVVIAGTTQAAGRVFYDGFESGNTNLWVQDATRNRCQVVTAAADGGAAPLGGTQMTRCNWNGTVGFADPAAYETIVTPNISYTNELFYRTRVRVDQNLEATGLSQTKVTRIQGDFQHEVYNFILVGNSMANAVNDLPTYWGGASGDNTASRVGWHTIEFYFNHAAGTLKIWHDDVLIRNATGYSMPVHYGTFYLTSNWSDGHDAVNYVYFDEFEVYTDIGTGGSGSMANGTMTQGADTTPPTVTSVSPPNGATGVPPTGTITITFSESMTPATITNSTIQLRDAGNVVVPSAVSYTAGSLIATLTPNNMLTVSSTYTVQVSNGPSGVKDEAGNALAAMFAASFMTGSGTTQDLGYTIIGSSVDSESPDHLSGNKITVGAQPVNITSASVHVGPISAAPNNAYQVGIYTDVSGTPGVLVANSSACALTANTWNTCPIVAVLSASTNYWIMYNTNGLTVNSNCLHYNSPTAGSAAFKNGGQIYGTWPSPYGAATIVASASYSFYLTATTVDVDTTLPTILTVTPPEGVGGVPLTEHPTVTFSEAMDASTITASTITLRDPGATVVPATVTYAATPHIATLIPTSSLLPDTEYLMTVTGGVSGVKDIAGNAQAGNVVWTWSTGSTKGIRALGKLVLGGQVRMR